MAHQWIRGNLLNSTFPFLTDLWGQSIMMYSLDEQTSQNTPQIFYADNIIPTTAGYQTVGLDSKIASLGVVEFDYVLPITYPIAGIIANINCLFAPNVGAIPGATYVNDPQSVPGGWITNNIPGGFPIPTQPNRWSYAFVNGVTYIYAANIGCLKYDPSLSPRLQIVVLTGLNASDIIGICEANGYMIAWDSSTIFNSSTVNPTDFIPSLVTGAGSEGINEAKTNIVFCATISGGFLIYCDQNVVQANYTGNINFPFKFQEIPGSGGVSIQHQITYRANASGQYAWTTKGLQRFSIGSDAQDIAPQATEFLTCGYYETIDINTLQISRVAVNTATFNPKVNLICEQYLFISYGKANGQFTRALVYDTLLNKWGRLVVNHVDIFEFLVDMTAGLRTLPQARNRVGILQNDGTTYVLDFQMVNSDDGQSILLPAVMILGRFQLQRNKGVYHQRTELQNLFSSELGGLEVNVIPSYNGRSLEPSVNISAPSNIIQSDSGYIQMGGKIYGKNICIAVQGEFQINYFGVDLVIGAER